MGAYSIQKQTLSDLADATRWVTGTWDSMSPSNMTEALSAMQYGRERHIETFAPEPWSRPEGWPNLDALADGEESDYCLMTYDASRKDSVVCLYILTSDSQPAIVELGHESNSVFVVDESTSVRSGTVYTRWLTDYDAPIVVRVTGSLARVTGRTASDGLRSVYHRSQPVVERVAHLPHATAIAQEGTSTATGTWGYYSLERDRVSNGDGSALKSLYGAWSVCYALQSLEIMDLRTPNVANMSSLLNRCALLTSVDLSGWDVRKVTSLTSAFRECRSIKSLDLSGWKLDAATNLSYAFMTMSQLTSLSLPAMDAATNLSYTFNGCRSIESLDLSGWNTSKVTTMDSMFTGCYSLCKVDLSECDLSRVTSFTSMFNDCRSLRCIHFGTTENRIATSVANMFYLCRSLQYVDLSWLHLTSKCTNVYRMFYGCSSIRSLDLPDDWDMTGLGSGTNTANSMFADCLSLESLTGIKDWRFRLSNSLISMFNGCHSLRELDVSGWDVSTVTSFASMFANCRSLTELDLSGWDVKACRSLASMFNGCNSLKTVGDIDGWDTSKVTAVNSMFINCFALEEPPNITQWDLSIVTTTTSMFSGCHAIEVFDFPGLDLPACTTIATMFNACYRCRRIDLSGLSVPKLSTAPSTLMGNCYSLKDVYPPSIGLAHSYASDVCLTHESLMRILEALPTVTTAPTLNLTDVNLDRLTAEERAIATSKGWILAD